MKYFFTLLFLFTGMASFAQPEGFLKEFYGFQQKDEIVLKWTVNKGNTCNGIRILRSADSLIYNEVGSIAGVCGSSSDDEKYTFLDTFPISNSKNFYKLDLGGQFYSSVVSVQHIDVGDNQYFIDYNGKPKILFFNPNNEEVTLYVFDLRGQLVYTKKSNENNFSFNELTLPYGIYLFAINGNIIYFSGKIFLY